MKTYRFDFGKKFIFGFIGLIILAIAGIALTLWRFFSAPAYDTFSVLKLVLPLLISFLILAIVISIMAYSVYQIDDEKLYTKFGFLTSSWNLSDIVSATLDISTEKLTVEFADKAFMVISVKQEWQNDFIQNLIEKCPSIEYKLVESKKKDDDDTDNDDNTKTKKQ